MKSDSARRTAWIRLEVIIYSVAKQAVRYTENFGVVGRRMLSLWFAYPDDLCSQQATDTSTVLLSEDERTRWQSFRFDRDRRQYLTTRVLVRTALSQRLQSTPQSLHFSSNPWGKPVIHPDNGIRFNASNCPALVACLIANTTEVGVDAEPLERSQEIARLGPHLFSPEEQRQFEALPDLQKLDRALTLWTLKESWIKARGMGLSIPLNKVSFHFSDSGADIRLNVDKQFREGTVRNWRYSLLDHAGHRIALTVDSSNAPNLERWELHPLLSPPVHLPASGEVWYPLPRH